MPAPISLSSCQQKGMQLLEQTRQNIFITGLAGSGKSFLIQQFLKGKDTKTFPIVASTGMAAVLVGGRTFHSFFGLGILEGGFERTLAKAMSNRPLKKRLKQAGTVIIDEISMLPALALDCAEAICRLSRENNEPWGGLRLVAVGDFSQLPPVQKSGERRSWAFQSQAWRLGQLTPLVLKTILRSEDKNFLNILNLVRQGEVNEDVRDYLNARVDLEFSNLEKPYLFSRRFDVDRFNENKLALIDSPLMEFPTEFWGPLPAQTQLQRLMPIPKTLQLKKTSLVMVRINDPLLRYVNGSLGIVVDASKETLTIQLKKSKRYIDLEPTLFSLLDGEGNAVATAKNFPVNLAYATTIHKAQGSTMDEMVADLRQLWEPGQAYVALSRLKAGSGLTLAGWDESSIKCDAQVMDFHRSIGLIS